MPMGHLRKKKKEMKLDKAFYGENLEKGPWHITPKGVEVAKRLEEQKIENRLRFGALNKKETNSLKEYLKNPGKAMKINELRFKNAELINRSLNKIEEKQSKLDEMIKNKVSKKNILKGEIELKRDLVKIFEKAQKTKEAKGLSAKNEIKGHLGNLDVQIKLIKKAIEVDEINREMTEYDKKDKNYPKNLILKENKAEREYDILYKKMGKIIENIERKGSGWADLTLLE